jgi:peptide/nickel transport system permease protein
MRGISLSYLIRRLGVFVFVVYVAATINFLIPRMAPGNPIGAITSRVQQASAGIEGGEAMYEAYREMFGLNDPLHIQYLTYLWNTVRLELGFSLSAFPAGVWEVIRPSIMWTIGLITVSVIITFILGIAAGALLAWRGTPMMVKALIPITMVFSVLPYYLLALLLLYALAFNTGMFPMGGAYDSRLAPAFNWTFIQSVARHAVLPALSIVLSSLGLWALTMRALMVNTIGEDYMLLADAKGLKSRRILWWYAVRNAIPPQMTQLAGSGLSALHVDYE